MKELPPPLSCHPALEAYPHLRVWIEESSSQRWLVPVPPVVRSVEDARPGLGDINVLTFTKEKAWAVAPYVGDPFVYCWYVGTDQYGRSVTSDSWIIYLPEGPRCASE